MGRYDRRRDACSVNAWPSGRLRAAKQPDGLMMEQNSCVKGETLTGKSHTHK